VAFLTKANGIAKLATPHTPAPAVVGIELSDQTLTDATRAYA